MKKLILKGVNLNHFPEMLPVSDDMVSITTSVGIRQVVDIPDDARYVVFNSNNIFYVSYDEDDVVLPNGDPSQVTTRTEQNPAQRFIGDKQKINVLSDCTATITIAFYG